MDKITHAEVRMYRMGTGDCFIIKFFSGSTNTFTMMIDCGTWQGSRAHLETYIKNLKEYISENKSGQSPTIDLLVVTHEHKDHVYGFDACKDLFLENFSVKKIWMGWTENDASAIAGDPLGDKVKQWKEEHGQRKMDLNIAAQHFNELFGGEEKEKEIQEKPHSMAAFQFNYAKSLDQFADLHFSARGGEYVGDLEGMRVVKKDIAKNNISYLKPGQIISNPDEAEGLRFYVLGPPLSFDAIKTEDAPANEPDETFAHSHNNKGTDNPTFAAAILHLDDPQPLDAILPFNQNFIVEEGEGMDDSEKEMKNIYEKEPWRTIEHDWLNSAGSLALRMNSITNNLSLALAIEFIDSGRVMLFPGDAEYGSWKSWHNDITWDMKDKYDDNKPLKTEGLLGRTVFFKVAHHLSHNGTPKRQGVEMITSTDLVAMATLDYDVIAPRWTSTMPNRYLISDLLIRTKGRLIIMNEKNLFLDPPANQKPLHLEIEKARNQFMNSAERADFEEAFTKDSSPDKLFFQYKVKA